MAKNKTIPLEEALQVMLASDGDNPLRQMLEWMVQSALEHEMSAHLGAEVYERSDKRLGYRNGHRPRVFTTRVGDLELLVPQDRTEDGVHCACDRGVVESACRDITTKQQPGVHRGGELGKMVERAPATRGCPG